MALLRHAKSSWDDPDLDDHRRPLNPRGRAAATQMGDYLRREAIAPELVLCSTARRAQETLELLSLGPTSSVLVEDALYGATVSRVLDRLRRIDPAVMSVLVVGHNPTMQDLAQVLAGDAEVVPVFPTGALADLVFRALSWTDLSPGIARLRHFVTPRSLV